MQCENLAANTVSLIVVSFRTILERFYMDWGAFLNHVLFNTIFFLSVLIQQARSLLPFHPLSHTLTQHACADLDM